MFVKKCSTLPITPLKDPQTIDGDRHSSCGYTLLDPEVASKESSTDGKSLFCTGNVSTNAIYFTSAHICNQFCKLLQLPNL
jgi:hypothetical protein